MLLNLCRANRGTFVFKDVLDDFYLELRKKIHRPRTNQSQPL